MKRKRWTFEKCQEEALKYTTRSDFQKKAHGAYEHARKRGWIPQITMHMEILQRTITFEEASEEALKHKTKTEFSTNSPKAYGAAHRFGWIDKICSHMICGRRFWTFEKCKEEALKYKIRNEFKDNNTSAYSAALNKGWIDRICMHMKPCYETWTNEMLILEAKKFLTRNEFKHGNNKAYRIARYRDIIDDACAHMKHVGYSSKPEDALFEHIEKLYFTAKKLVDRKVKIDGKPHIHGFDIDIFIVELNKGIEFDGKYHHSFNGLKRGRPNWPDEDIMNYHQIKDDYFRSKGIELLHIKEEDWNKNKEECIQKCLTFLKGE